LGLLGGLGTGRTPLKRQVRLPAMWSLCSALRFYTAKVESRCGAVALGCTYLFPPLSSGGALVV
jgi:hypothetical protein